MNTTSVIQANADERFENPRSQPDWWAPLWQGLVLDRQGKHYMKIKSALWLFMYFILCANRKTGSLKRKIPTISEGMGVKTRTIRLWLKILQRGEYIKTANNGRCMNITICKWKTLTKEPVSVRQSGSLLPDRVTRLCRSRTLPNGDDLCPLSQNSNANEKSYDITMKKKIFKNNNDTSKRTDQDREYAFALKISQALMDEKNFPFYLSSVRQYPQEIIQQAFAEAMKTPASKIKKTRGALFNYLVKFYAK